MRQGRPPLLQEAADGRVALEPDGDLVGATGFATGAGSGKELGARRPVGLVFGDEPRQEHGVAAGGVGPDVRA